MLYWRPVLIILILIFVYAAIREEPRFFAFVIGFILLIFAPPALGGWLGGRRGVAIVSAAEAILAVALVGYWLQIPLVPFSQNDVGHALESELRRIVPKIVFVSWLSGTLAAWWRFRRS
jgi:uncharacterized membrane protein required for colicin V production